MKCSIDYVAWNNFLKEYKTKYPDCEVVDVKKMEYGNCYNVTILRCRKYVFKLDADVLVTKISNKKGTRPCFYGIISTNAEWLTASFNNKFSEVKNFEFDDNLENKTIYIDTDVKKIADIYPFVRYSNYVLPKEVLNYLDANIRESSNVNHVRSITIDELRRIFIEEKELSYKKGIFVRKRERSK